MPDCSACRIFEWPLQKVIADFSKSLHLFVFICYQLVPMSSPRAQNHPVLLSPIPLDVTSEPVQRFAYFAEISPILDSIPCDMNFRLLRLLFVETCPLRWLALNWACHLATQAAGLREWSPAICTSSALTIPWPEIGLNCSNRKERRNRSNLPGIRVEKWPATVKDVIDFTCESGVRVDRFWANCFVEYDVATPGFRQATFLEEDRHNVTANNA
jgi:hypothetical protein